MHPFPRRTRSRLLGGILLCGLLLAGVTGARASGYAPQDAYVFEDPAVETMYRTALGLEDKTPVSFAEWSAVEYFPRYSSNFSYETWEANKKGASAYLPWRISAIVPGYTPSGCRTSNSPISLR